MEYSETQTVREILDGEREVSFTPAELGFDSLPVVDVVVLQMVDEEGYIELAALCSESLGFHANHYPELFQEDEDGEYTFTVDGFGAVMEVFSDRYGANVFSDDDGYLRFSVNVMAAPDEDIVFSKMVQDLYEVLAQVENELDPGTFGAEYVMRLVAEAVKDDA